MKTAGRTLSSGRQTFPLRVKRGKTVVKIYNTPVMREGKTYPCFTVAFSMGGKRRRRCCSDLAEAKAVAAKVAEEAEQGTLGVQTMSAADRVRIADALREAAAVLGLERASMENLVGIVREYGEAVAELPPKTTLLDAVRFFSARHPANMPKLTVSEAVEAMLEHRRLNRRSEVHLKDLANRLGRFAATFQVPIASLSGRMVEEYLLNLRGTKGQCLSGRTLRNTQRTLNSFFRFARRRRYIPQELLEEVTEIEPFNVEPPKPGVFAPEQMARILSAAPDDIIPPLVLGAFCGLRTAELQRVDWSDVKLAQAVVIVGAEIAKVGTRRVVPIPENALAWLTPLARTEGRITPAPTDRALNHRFARVAHRVGVKWVRNGLRHSFCSYRLAVTQHPAQVATEAGNSANMIQRHYKALVTAEEGRHWFDIWPSRKANVVPLAAGAAAV